MHFSPCKMVSGLPMYVYGIGIGPSEVASNESVLLMSMERVLLEQCRCYNIAKCLAGYDISSKWSINIARVV